MTDEAPPDYRQFKIQLEDRVLGLLEAQRTTLGFHTPNQLAALYIHAFADVPPQKIYEVLAYIQKYTATKGPIKSRK